MKSYYKVVVSSPVHKPVQYLPYTIPTKFRSMDRAKRRVMAALKQMCDVVLVEMCCEGIIATWEYQPNGRCSFDCNDELAERVDGWKEVEA